MLNDRRIGHTRPGLLGADETQALARTVAAARPGGPIERMTGLERDTAVERARAARERLILANTGLAGKAARLFGNGTADAYADALLGLLWAVDRYDPERGIKFSTYAMFWLRKAVSEGRARGQGIRLPGEARSALYRMRAEADRLGAARLDDPRVAAAAGVKPDMARALSNAAGVAVSLDAGNDEAGVTFAETLPAAEPADQPVDEPDRSRLVALLGELPAREQAVIVARFGLDGRGVRTLVEVGAELGVSRQRVFQLEASALARLRSADVSPAG